MPTKTKKIKKSALLLSNLASQLGIVVMTAATTMGTLEINSHVRAPVILPGRSVLATETTNSEFDSDNTLMREREESPPHFISYSVSQRTPSRSGKR